jgi:hypothetical protein
VEVVFAQVSGGKNLASSRIFELHYRIRNICQLPRMRKQNVTIAGPSHKMRPSSPARLYEPPLRSVRSAKNYNSPASISAVRPSTKKRHNWNDLEIVANCKDTPIRRCWQSTRNQRGNWRNERRPCVAMTGPTRAGDKSTTPDMGSPYFDGKPDSLASMDRSRRTFPAVRRITIRWKLDLILLNPPNHTSSIPAAGVNFATSL